jgi:hypothetical protein
MPTVYTAAVVAVWWLNEVYSVGRLREQRAKLLAVIGSSEVTRDEE